MVQIINREGFGGRLGTALGSGISQGLQALAEKKLQDIMQKKTVGGLQALGFTPEESRVISVLPPDLQNSFLSNLFQREPVQSAGLNNLTAPLAQQQLQPQFEEKQVPGSLQAQQIPAESLMQEKPRTLADVLRQPTTREKRVQRDLQIKEENLALKKRVQEREDEKFVRKETKDYIDTALKSEKSAKTDNIRLKAIQDKIEKGNLPNAALWSFLTRLEEGGPIPTGAVGAALGTLVPGVGTAAGALAGGLLGAITSPIAGLAKSYIRSTSPDIEEVEKLSADFIKGAKEFFGSRVTDADLKAYMATIPTLMQTDAGKKRVIKNLLSFNELKLKEAKAVRDIIKENDGKRPLDIEQQVQDRISDDIDKIAKDIISG